MITAPRGIPRRRPNVSQVKSIPAPVGGWNARDSVASMDAKDAIQLDNLFPSTTDVMLRRGYSEHVTGINSVVEGLASYNAPTTSALFACTGDAIYDVTTAGAVGSAAVSLGITTGRWQHINFNVPGGAAWLCMVNGADAPQYYNGTAWTAIDASSTPSITGVTTSNLAHINVFKRRIWFVESNSTKAWYLPTDSIGGAATSFDVGPLFTDGGYLMAMGTWSLDAGEGLDDHAVFISSKGQVAVYKGTDPASASTFALAGVYSVGAPIGRRCFIKYGGDLLVITREGVFPLSKALLSSRLNPRVAITDKIQQAMSQAVADYGSNFGWQLMQYPNANMLILNVPASTTEFQQYAMNTISGAWCRFTGWDASCWELYEEEIYYGGDGVVAKAWTGYSDNGADIVGDAIPAFSYFGTTAQLKRWTMARPILSAQGAPTVLLGINTDFDTSAPLGTPTLSNSPAGLWDSAIWDSAIWGGGLQIIRNWQSVSGLGYAASLHLKIASKYYDIRWQSTDYVYERGGVL
jgi:hypothetical protein